jgi:hypothetical protein
MDEMYQRTMGLLEQVVVHDMTEQQRIYLSDLRKLIRSNLKLLEKACELSMVNSPIAFAMDAHAVRCGVGEGI